VLRAGAHSEDRSAVGLVIAMRCCFGCLLYVLIAIGLGLLLGMTLLRFA
jgi:hypothetical protein